MHQITFFWLTALCLLNILKIGIDFTEAVEGPNSNGSSLNSPLLHNFFPELSSIFNRNSQQRTTTIGGTGSSRSASSSNSSRSASRSNSSRSASRTTSSRSASRTTSSRSASRTTSRNVSRTTSSRPSNRSSSAAVSTKPKPKITKKKILPRPTIKDPYQSKIRYFRSRFPKPHLHNCKDNYDINVRRKYVLTDAMGALRKVENPRILRTRLSINFKGENGLDVGGVSREFFCLLSKKMFHPKMGYFLPVTKKNSNLIINSCSNITSLDHLKHFRMFGMLTGLALFNGNEVIARFSRFFLKTLAARPITLQDVQKEDPETHSFLDTILKCDPKDLALTFTASEIINGRVVNYPLCNRGAQKELKETNKNLYVRNYIQVRYVERVEKQMRAFMRGFHTIIPRDILQLFTTEQIGVLLCGSEKIDVKDWKRNTKYKGGYTAQTPVIKWFWEIVSAMDKTGKSKLLQFLIGTTRLPVNGFKDLEGATGKQLFTIQKTGTTKHFPVAHTCFNRLDLPPYPNKRMLKKKLMKALECSAGTGFTVI